MTVKKPKVVSLSINYEVFPGCRQTTTWYHPDMILGCCIQHIGDPRDRIEHKREYHGSQGRRVEEARPSVSGRYPLWSTEDVRSVPGSPNQVYYVNDTKPIHLSQWGVAFHFHNFFDSLETLRHKQATYGHPEAHKRHWMLSNFSDGDMDVVVRCVHQLDNFHNPASVKRRVVRPFERMGGPKPIYFLNETYRKERWRFVKEMVLKDEAKYGSLYAGVLAKRKQQGAS